MVIFRDKNRLEHYHGKEKIWIFEKGCFLLFPYSNSLLKWLLMINIFVSKGSKKWKVWLFSIGIKELTPSQVCKKNLIIWSSNFRYFIHNTLAYTFFITRNTKEKKQILGTQQHYWIEQVFSYKMLFFYFFPHHCRTESAFCNREWDTTKEMRPFYYLFYNEVGVYKREIVDIY